MPTSSYDFIIVGGGLSGCVLASRLRTYNQSARILLIEAGPDTRENSTVQNPQLLNLGGELDWAYQSEEVPGVLGRSITINSGKGLGGSSAINSGTHESQNQIHNQNAILMGNRRLDSWICD